MGMRKDIIEMMGVHIALYPLHGAASAHRPVGARAGGPWLYRAIITNGEES